MSAEQNKKVVRRLICELLGHTDLALAEQIVAPGYVEHDPLLGEWAGPQGIAELSRSLRTAFPDGHFTINGQFAEGDRVVTRWAFRGTQFGDFAGIPASGKGVWLTGISVHRLAEGMIQEGWTALERVKWGSREGSAALMLGQLQGDSPPSLAA
jgi:predicted ester cyclase